MSSACWAELFLTNGCTLPELTELVCVCRGVCTAEYYYIITYMDRSISHIGRKILPLVDRIKLEANL